MNACPGTRLKLNIGDAVNFFQSIVRSWTTRIVYKQEICENTTATAKKMSVDNTAWVLPLPLYHCISFSHLQIYNKLLCNRNESVPLRASSERFKMNRIGFFFLFFFCVSTRRKQLSIFSRFCFAACLKTNVIKCAPHVQHVYLIIRV